MVVRFRLKELIAEKERKENRRITYGDIADETHVSTRTLSLMATQKMKSIGVGTIERLAEYFDCEPGDLIIRE